MQFLIYGSQIVAKIGKKFWDPGTLWVHKPEYLGTSASLDNTMNTCDIYEGGI